MERERERESERTAHLTHSKEAYQNFFSFGSIYPCPLLNITPKDPNQQSHGTFSLRRASPRARPRPLSYGARLHRLHRVLRRGRGRTRLPRGPGSEPNPERADVRMRRGDGSGVDETR